MTEQPSVISGALKRPFAEQTAFFRAKLGNLVPTSRWDAIEKAAHDRGFMVAGAAKADLLTDLAAAVDRSIAEGKSLEAFRTDFMAIVQKNGWQGFTGDESSARRAWRTRLIYQTNATSSYNAGREAQIKEGGYTLKVYHHNDSVRNPRPQHLAWDGLTLPVDHPFWRTHSPQNGWGCQCSVSGARSATGAKRLGGNPEQKLPEGWDATDPKTGAPVGIDKGWDYAPGASVTNEVRQMAAKTLQWDYQQAKAYMQEIPNRDDLARSYRALPSVAADIRRYAQRAVGGMTYLEIPPYKTLGLLTEVDVAEVSELTGKKVAGYDFAIDQYAPKHIARAHGDPKKEKLRGQRAVTVEDYTRLPQMLNAPDRVVGDGESKVGRTVVRYEKKIGGETFTAAFEVRKQRRMLTLQSFWIKCGVPPR